MRTYALGARARATPILLASLCCVERGEVLRSSEPSVANAVPPGTGVAQVSAGLQHTCALSGDSIQCWGDNDFGQLGVGSIDDQRPPTALALRGWGSVHTGERHTCAVTQLGEVYCWGDGSRGQLGQGVRVSSGVPVAVDLAAPARAIATGFFHTCAVLETGALWCWGDNNEGQLGQDDDYAGDESRETDALSPVEVRAPGRSDAGTSAWSTVDVGEGHSCALQTDDTLWCWGRNSQWQLGTAEDQGGQHRLPILIIGGQRWLSVDASQNYTCALDGAGAFWCWGYNMGIRDRAGDPFGLERSDDETTWELRAPTRLSDGPWMAMSSNMFHTCAINLATELWCWGRSVEGQLGLPDEALQMAPVQVASGVASVSTGTYSTCYITNEGGLFCAGQNADGQVRAGSRSTVTEFLRVTLAVPEGDAG
jgi:alpha-tubulin suppressor-like RCC1 family protein